MTGPLSAESLSIRRTLGEQRGIAVTLDSLGMLLVAQGRGADALAPLEEALSLVRRLGNVALEATVLVSLGLAALSAADRSGPERCSRKVS